jgi:hypothetical protein
MRKEIVEQYANELVLIKDLASQQRGGGPGRSTYQTEVVSSSALGSFEGKSFHAKRGIGSTTSPSGGMGGGGGSGSGGGAGGAGFGLSGPGHTSHNGNSLEEEITADQESILVQIKNNDARFVSNL